MQRMAAGVMGIFSSKKSNADNTSQRGNTEQDIMPFYDGDKEPESAGSKRPPGGILGIHFQESGVSKTSFKQPHSQAVENEKKGIQNMMGQGITNMLHNLKKPASQKSGGKAGSQRSGGGGSVVTSLSDLEKIEKIMNEAQHADKNIVKYFGKHLEEFRRDMHYYKEIVFSDMFTQYGAGLPSDNNNPSELIDN